MTAALFSTGGAAIKSIQMPGVQVASLRSGFAAVALLLFLPAARRNWNVRVLLVSVAYAVTLALFVIATKLTTGANAIFLQETSTLYILLLSMIFLKEKATRSDLWLMLPLSVGMALFFFGSETAVRTAPNPPLGNLLAAGSGLSYALIVIGFRWLSRQGDEDASIASVGLGNVLAFILCMPFAFPFAPGRPADWLILVYLGVVQIGLAYFLMTKAMQYVPAFEASLLLLLEPVLNPIWTWLIHREQPSKLALAGGFLILCATAAKTWWSARQQNDILIEHT